MPWPKAFAMFPYDEDNEMAYVYRNPPRDLLKRIIGKFDSRALLDMTGTLYTWPQNNCFHNDVVDYLKLGSCLFLKLENQSSPHPPVSVKGPNYDPEPFNDVNELALLHNNRSLVSMYGKNFPVDTFNWN